MGQVESTDARALFSLKLDMLTLAIAWKQCWMPGRPGYNLSVAYCILAYSTRGLPYVVFYDSMMNNVWLSFCSIELGHNFHRGSGSFQNPNTCLNY